jgi:hypothetical protein
MSLTPPSCADVKTDACRSPRQQRTPWNSSYGRLDAVLCW